MVKRVNRLYDICDQMGPGGKGGRPMSGQNLSAYRQNARIIGVHNGRESLTDADLAFDIERIVNWENSTFQYSLMIDAYYKKSEGPSDSEFINTVGDFKGFVRTRSELDYICLDNIEKNVFTNWSVHKSEHWWNDDRLCIGVIQRNDVDTLAQTLEMLPYFINLHNALNPQRILSQEIIDKSVARALENDKYFKRKLREK